MKLVCLFITTVFMVFPGFVRAQLDNSAFHDFYGINASDSSAIIFGLEAFGYVRNNEFKDDIVPGYTLFGYQFKPYFTYYPSGRIRLDAGGFFQKDFGDEDFREIRPVFSVKYTRKNLSMIFGTLEGAMSHRLIEPLYNFENVINRRVEDGLELKYVNDQIFFDTWIEWINMIDFGEDALEEFNFGVSFNFRLLENSAFILDIPVQLLANHRGGEIDISPEPANTILNTAAGIGIELPLHNTRLIQSIRLDNYYGRYDSQQDPGYLPFLNGDGWFLNLTGKSGWFELMLSYWHGDQFYAPYGSPLYQSVFFDPDNTAETQNQRDLLFIRLLFEHEFGHGLTLAFRFEPVFDFNKGHFDHSEGLYLRYRTDFLLHRKR
ncbi:MAG: hypothetical protein KFF73_15110 [Cyclobacteriaceae bacterium]|nr:hypothetical protein [Cyclobacteriaceae bacterium]